MRTFIGSLGFVAGSATAAALFSSGHAHQSAPAAVAQAQAPASADRIPVTNAEFRQAYGARLIDGPIKTVLNVGGPMKYGDFRWDDKGVPPGPAWVRVDLRSQLISVFRAGHEIGTAVILYGADGVPTPTGRFPILAKLRSHRSATYDAPMPYTLRLTRDGVSIHGSNVRWGFATHGCVGVPTAFAAKLFDSVSKGDEVYIVA